MNDQILDDLDLRKKERYLRTPRLERLELWIIILTLFIFVSNLYELITSNFIGLYYREIILDIFIFIYLILWRISSINFDNNPQGNKFVLPTALKILEVFFCIAFLWKGKEGFSLLWSILFDENFGWLFWKYIYSFLGLILYIPLPIICVFYLITTSKAIKYVNRV